MENNPICKLLNIEYPVFQGGMAWIADARLAAAVSNAGGKELTDRPFGVNLMLMSPFIAEAVQVVCEEKIPVVTTGAGNPAQYMEALQAAGVQVICVVASVSLAVMMERMGAQMPIPVRARLPSAGMWPMYMRSTTL